MINVSTNLEKNQNKDFMFNELLSENPTVYEIMRKRYGTATLATGGSIAQEHSKCDLHAG
jgi:hypothetical protein